MWENELSRLFSMLGHLSPNSQVTIEFFAKEYGVSKSIIKRDLETILAAQLGVSCHENKIKISKQGYKKIQSWLRS